MRHLFILAALLATSDLRADFQVHEWGTFTSLVGSDGKTQDGMYHEDEKLPDFVHGFGETQSSSLMAGGFPCPDEIITKGCIPKPFLRQNRISQKMETPVVYFYSDQPRAVRVEVDFPEGVISQTYPAPVVNLPNRSSAPVLANGKAVFDVNILPFLEDSGIPYVDPANIYSHARNVASNVIQAGSEKEKFIFYRGLGRFQPKMDIQSEKGSISITQCVGCGEVREAILVHVNEAGKAALLPLGRIKDQPFGRSVSVGSSRVQELIQETSRSDGRNRHILWKTLVGAGLNHDEAQSMVDTWAHGYLAVPGLRLLYVLPREEVEAILPLRISPQPDRLERVFIGRIEVLLDTQEHELLDQILRLRDLFEPASLGRFAEPILHRIREVYLSNHFPPTKDDLALFSRLIERVSER